MSTVLSKAPADVLDYDVRFHRWLTDGDHIVNATATIAEADAVVDNVVVAERVVKVWVSGGEVGQTADVTVLATTMQGRTKQVCFSIKVKDC